MRIRLISCFFLFILLIQSTFCTLAEEAEEYAFPATGITFTMPQGMHSSKGLIFPIDNGALAADPGVFYGYLTYLCHSQKEMDAFFDELSVRASDLDEQTLYDTLVSFYEQSVDIFSLFCIDGNRGLAELDKIIQEASNGQFTYDYAEELGQEGEYSYFLLGEDIEKKEDLLLSFNKDTDVYIEEIRTLFDDHTVFHDCFTFSKPQMPESSEINVIPDTVSFNTVDLDGQSFSSSDFFAHTRVTMVNVWATWCPPCREELPDLAALAPRLEEKGCSLIGICLDAVDSNSIETAKQLLLDAGASYTVLVPTDDIMHQFPVTAIPTTFFISPEGRILGSPIVGARVNAYEKRVDEELAALSQ
ncbi:MAG: TlpA family protein disulfide reductase [Clostridia bacterium]|nr:TlpA family protein disulfide reductase [Clostridia bacterium]